MQNLDQIRAALAFETAARHAGDEKFLGLSLKLPMMFQTNGFLATWAFLLAKKEGEHLRCLTALREYLATPILALPVSSPKETEDPTEDPTVPYSLFLRWIGAREDAAPLSVAELRRLTEEAIEFSGWLKRAAKTYGGGND